MERTQTQDVFHRGMNWTCEINVVSDELCNNSCRDTIASSFDSRDSRPFSGIPYPRNLELVGCANVLDKIHSHMRIMRCVTLCGIGGVG
jgi:hypothetical protein